MDIELHQRILSGCHERHRDETDLFKARVAELEAHNETRNIELLASVQQCAKLKEQLAEAQKLILLARDAMTDFDYDKRMHAIAAITDHLKGGAA